jgi:hypothetical protein
MQRDWVDEIANETGATLLLMDGFDDCIVGTVSQFNRTFVVYDRRKVIKKLMDEQAMTEEEAWEFHEFNQISAFVGDHTPGFLDTVPVYTEEADAAQGGK